MKEREIVDKLIEYVENCGGDALLALYNQIYGSKDIAFDDVEWDNGDPSLDDKDKN